MFPSVSDRFIAGKPWEETQFVREATEAIRRGERYWRVRTLEDLAERLKRIETLHESIRTDGYLSQEELGTGRPWDEIVVAIDRDGRCQLVDGAHRLALAQVLGLESVPVVVALRHAEWVRFCTEVIAYADARGGRVYQPLPHPDLINVPSAQGFERVNLIRQNLPVTSGTLLDIGASSGAFCHAFEAIGFECVAVERSTKEAYILRRLRDAAAKRFEVIHGSVTDMKLDRRFDVTLALNIFHHFCKTREGFDALRHLLGRLDTAAMFFESHLPGDPQMQGAHVDLAPDEFASFVASQARLPKVKRIGQANTGRPRPIYLLTR